MATLVFRVSAQYDEVIKLRNEISKLEAQLKKMDVNKSPAAAKALETQLASTRQQMMGLVTEAAKAGAEIENGFKKKIYDASQTVNGLSEKIIAQRAVIKDIEFDVKRLGDAYRTALKNNPIGASGKLAEYNAARKALDEEKAALFGLTQQQAEARLSVKKLRDEYSLYKKEAGDTVEINNGLSLSWGKMLGVIGGAAALKSLASQIVRVRGEFQSMQTAIETMVGKDVASGLMAQLKEMAKISPLTLTDMVNAEKMMLGFNIQAEDTVRYLQALSDISMGDSVKFKSLTLAFSQISAAGKLMGQDLNQMINAGFNPLQIIAEKTGKSISTLKDEMSKGAVSAEMVQQAFIDATSAGGKFYQMSENASKTINGQLSMMQDALDNAFNEMGQASEGVIMEGIQLTTTLIQNYETVGKVLVGLVATYGAYRTAVMLATIATSKHTIAEVALTNARVIARKAQLLLNAAMLTNPYVAVATVVTALVATMWTLSDSTSSAAKATREYNQAKEELGKKEEEHKRRIDELLTSSRDESLATLTRQKSLEELRKEYPKIFEQYDLEKLKLEDILNIKRQINEEDSKQKVEKTKNDYYSLKETVSNQQRYLTLYDNPELRKNMSDEDMNIWRMFAGKQSYVEVREQMQKDAEKLKLLQRDVIADNIASYKANLKEFSEERLKVELQMAQSEASKRNGFNVGGIMVKGGDLAGIITSINNEIENRKPQTTYQQDLAVAKLDWETAKKGYESLIKDQNATTEQVKKAREEMEAKEKAYKELGGTTEIKSTDKDKQKQEQEKLYDQLLQLRFKNQQDEINLMKEGADKKRKQIELDYQKEYAEIQKLEKEWGAKNGGKLSQEQSIEISRRYTNAENKYNSSITSLEGGFSPKELEKSMNEYLSAYGNYIEKRNAIIALGEEKKHGKNKWEQKSIDEETKRAISDLDIEAAKTTSSISQLFGDMRDKTLKDLQEIGEKGKAALEFLKSGEWSEEKGLEFGITKEQFETISQSPEKLKDISDALRDNKRAADDLRPAYDKVADGLKKVFNSGNDTKKLKEGLSDIQDGMNDIMQIGSFLSDTFSSLGDAFGNNTLSGIADGINVAMNAMNSAMQGAQAGSMFGPIGAAAGAAIGLVTSLASSIAKIHDAKNEKRIQTLQDQIDILDRSYEKLGDSIEKAYSKDASNLIDQQNKLLEQQKVLIQQQIREEQDKKKTDDERIKEWQQQIEDINKLIEDNKEAAVDAIFGEDLKSAIDDFASAYAEAWANGENRAESAKETVKNMMRQMVTESIKAAMQSSGAMEKIRQKLQEFYSDNVLSSWEQDYIYSMAEELQKELDRQFGWADSLMKDEEGDKEQQSASSRGFGTEMTHEDAGELSGRFTAVYESNLRIETATQQQTVAITELRGSISALTSQVSGMYNIADETRTILANSYLELQQIRENTGEIVKPIKQIQADIAEVKRNTSRL